MESKVDHAERLAARPVRCFHETPARISMRSARAAYFGPGLDLAPHRNAVAVVALAVDEPFELAFLGENRSAPHYEAHRGALIGPGRLHHLKAPGPMAFVYLDALSDDHAAVQKVDLSAACKELSRDPLETWSIDRACAALSLPQRTPPDPRVAAILRAIDAQPDAFGNFEDITTSAGLSPSRCRALIREAAGIGFRRYRIWRRMACVARCLAEGRTLTEAAHAAGFASSAHLSTAFSAMFGLAPSTLLKAGVVFDLD
jgi:AraC-like DNA-binding protein